MLVSIMPSRAATQANKRAALVTGGAVRVGRAIAIALADLGMDVAIGYHGSSVEARRTVRAIEARGVRAIALPVDLRHPAAAQRVVKTAATQLGRLDVLVNSAAVFRRVPFPTVTAETYDEFLDVNLRGAFFCSQAAARVMERRGGHIVNLGDAAIARPMPGFIAYAISKAGLEAMTKHLASALRPKNIAVNAVAPGPVLRPRGYPLERWKKLTRNRTVTLEDVTAAVTFLATCPKSITGQTLSVDG